MKTETYSVTGMTCAACQANVTRCVSRLEGVKEVDVSLLAGRMKVTFDEGRLTDDAIVQAVQAIGYGAAPPASPLQEQRGGFRQEWDARRRRAEDHQTAMRRRLLWSVALLVPLMTVAMAPMLPLPLPAFVTAIENRLVFALIQLLLAVPILFLNRAFYQNGLRALWHRAPNMDSLVAVGSGASLLYGLAALFAMAWGFGHGDTELVHRYAHALYFESAAMILTLVTVGKYLEARSKAKTSDALDKLLDLAPATAAVVRDGVEITLPAEQVVAGDIVIIRPGERIPVDGEITEGRGVVDQSALTGESMPVEKGPGDTVLSATLNQNGSFRFRARQVGEDTTLSQIIRLVDEAGNTKAPIARLADKVSGVFVPVVMAIALVTAAVWLIAGQGPAFALTNAVAVLVISCPCALGLAAPVAILVGTGKAAEMGVLVKSAESLELLHRIDTVVVDKTGTVTGGHPAVTDVIPYTDRFSADELLAVTAAVEQGSSHPLAVAVCEEAARRGLTLPSAAEFQDLPGRGVIARVRDQRLAVGNAALWDEQDVPLTNDLRERLTALAAQGKTLLLIAAEGRPAGLIAVSDLVRPDSCQAVRELHRRGLRVVMLTGDRPETAEFVREQVGADEAVAGVLPAQKEAHIRALQQAGHKVAMVGDGINDAPALARADVGVAIGGGTDIAMESADVVLMKDSLLDVATAVDLSRAVVRNIHQNLFWAFFYNALGIPLAAGAFYPLWGLRLSPMIGSAAMSLSSVCVVSNALRLRRFRPRVQSASAPPVFPTANQTAAPTADEKGEITVKKQLKVEGMMCAHCQAHVQQALAAVEGVGEAVVDLDAGTATVTLTADVADGVLTDAVKQAGYTPVDCRTL